MAYVLETISSEDQDRILDDFTNDSEVYSYLKYISKEKLFPKNWAIDRDRNAYILIKPITVRTETAECPYLFFYGGCGYCIVNGNMFLNEFYFEKKYTPQSDQLPSILQEIKLAFSVYGLTGVGELNEFGMPEFRIVPNFSEEAKQCL